MAAQDDARENQLVDVFNLERPANRVRHGTDAILTLGKDTFEFELKSVTTTRGGLSTVRDLGRDHIEKWRNKHWIIALYTKGVLAECRYASPDDMAPWIEKKWSYIESDFRLADVVPQMVSVAEMKSVIGDKPNYTVLDAKRLQKLQMSAKEYLALRDTPTGYTPERMLEIFRRRIRYILERGSTLNNPHIPYAYFDHYPPITKNHAATLRRLLKAWSVRRRSLPTP